MAEPEPADRACLDQQAPVHSGLDEFQQGVGGHVAGAGHHLEVELLADHGRDHQDGLGAVGQPAQPVPDEVAGAGGQCLGQRLRPHLRHQPGQLDHVERGAAAALVDHARQVLVHGRAEPVPQDLGHLGFGEPAQRQAPGPHAGQLGHQRGRWAVQVGAVPAGGEHQQRQVRQQGGQHAQHPHRVRVGPVQVVQRHQERAFPGRVREQFHHGSWRVGGRFRRGGSGVGVTGLLLAEVEQRGQADLVGQAPQRHTALAHHRAQHGQPRPQRGRARLVRAAAHGHGQPQFGGTAGRGLGNAGLANARFAGDQQQPAPAAARPDQCFVHSGQHVGAAGQRGIRCGTGFHRPNPDGGWVRLRRGRRGQVQVGIVVQHGLFQPAQPGPWLDAEVVGEHAAGLAQHGQ